MGFWCPEVPQGMGDGGMGGVPRLRVEAGGGLVWRFMMVLERVTLVSQLGH